MTLHVKNRALLGASAIPAAVRKRLERKDDSASVVEIKKSFDDFMRGFETFKTKNDAAITELQTKGTTDVVTKSELEKLNTELTEIKTNINAELAKLKRPETKDANGNPVSPEMAEYSKKFSDFFRHGYGETKGSTEFREMMDLQKKAMQISSDTDGGFLARPEMETAIDATVKQVSPLRDVATVRTIGGISYKKLVSVHGTASGWVGETDARPQTQAPQLKELDFPAQELYAMPAATNDLLDDAFINIDQWLADEVALEFAFQEGAAFVNGNGVKKPWGILGYPVVANASYAWGSVGKIQTGVNGDYPAPTTTVGGPDALIDLFHALKSPYRKNATFLMNNNTLGKTRKLKDQQGRYYVETKLTISSGNEGGMVETILGKPVMETVDMPDPATGSLSVAFGDFKRGYLIVDRKGIRILRDPYSAKPYVLFYTTKRVGGGIQNFEAIKLLQFS